VPPECSTGKFPKRDPRRLTFFRNCSRHHPFPLKAKVDGLQIHPARQCDGREDAFAAAVDLPFENNKAAIAGRPKQSQLLYRLGFQ
jgi:hypothetical protein